MTTHQPITAVVDPSAPIDGRAVVDIGELIDTLANHAATQDPDAEPVPFAAGTFAMYAQPDGGVMFVTSGAPGTALEGVQHVRIPAGMIRAVSALAGGSKMDAARALVGMKPRRPKGPKAIEGPPGE